jgi:hypothetical protein
LRVLPWSVFGLYPEGTWWAFGAFGDLAEGYHSTGLRVGVWR